jgi:hypothetical protein
VKYTLIKLIELGDLKGDEILTLNRRSGPKQSARITLDGKVKTDDGKIHLSLSGAARHCLGRSVDGWTAWRLEDGQYIDSLRQNYSLEK